MESGGCVVQDGLDVVDSGVAFVELGSAIIVVIAVSLAIGLFHGLQGIRRFCGFW